MELDVGNLFGDREAESVGGSEGESDREEQQPNFGEEENEEQGETGGEEAAAATGEESAGKPIKPKRIVKNPLPKLDSHRLAGPRGMFALNKIFRNFKFKGKGYEREDLQELLKVLEHWAHRLYPKLPFKDTLEQIEKLGTQKNVQVNIKKLRLDMFTEGGEEGEEDNVRRGTDEDNSETTPVVDVFDELLGITTTQAPAAQPTTTTSIPMQTTLLPASQPAKPTTQLTEEQRERMERNKRLAIEKRLARLKRQQQEQQQQEQEQEKEESSTQQVLTTSSQVMDDFDKLHGPGGLPSTKKDKRDIPDDTEVMDGVANKLEGQEEKRETLDDSEELMEIVLDKLQGSGETVSIQERREAPEDTELMNGVEDKSQGPGETVSTQGDSIQEERNEAPDHTEGIQEERSEAPDHTEELVEPLSRMPAEVPDHHKASDQVPCEDVMMDEV